MNTIESRAVAWLAGSLGYFDPFDIKADAAPEQSILKRKAFVELSMLLAYRARLRSEPLESDYVTILEHVYRYASQPRYYENIARDHRALLLYGAAYAGLKVCGRDILGFRRVILQAVAARTATVFERIPYRVLDLLHFLEMAGIEHPLPSFENAFQWTVLARNPNLFGLNLSDAYAITHALFYMTDFGFRSANWGDQFEVGSARELVCDLLSLYQEAGNADLVGELIASLICLDAADSPGIPEGWSFIAGVQRPDGSIPGPASASGGEATAARTSGPEALWQSSYHTTIVVALAALMCERANHITGYPALQSRPASNIYALRPQASAADDALRASAIWVLSALQSENLLVAIRAVAALCFAPPATGDSPELRESLAQLSRRICTTEVNWDALGADTLLFAAWTFQNQEIACDAVEDALTTLADLFDPALLPEYPTALLAYHLLVRLGKLPAADPDYDMIAAAYTEQLHGEHIEAAEFSAQILQLMGCDPARLLRSVPERNSTEHWLMSALVDKFRVYDIGKASVILRALLLLAPHRSRLISDAIDCLVSQQNQDGSFGYFLDEDPDGKRTDLQVAWTLSAMAALHDFLFPERSLTCKLLPSTLVGKN